MRTYREIFFAYNGPGPWACTFCGCYIVSEDLDVHHRDENKKNNDPSNLGAAHRTCHASHHSTNRKMPGHSEHMKKLWREGRMKPHTQTEEARKKVSLARKGVPNPAHSERVRAMWAEGRYANRKPRNK